MSLPLAFISYASEDVQLARCIEYFLCKAFPDKLEIFIDVKIDTGESWQSKISDKLDKSRIFILLASAQSVKSINVAYEVATIATKCLRIEDGKPVWADAQKTGILFLPIILEDINTIFACIKQNVQWQDFRNPYDLHNQLEILAHSIKKHLNKSGYDSLEKSNKRSNYYANEFNDVPLKWRNNDYRKAQFVSRVLRNPTIQLLADSNRKLDNFFELNNTSNVLLAPYTISHKEKATKAEVWVVSENLNNDLYDEPIIKSVQENMQDKKIKYRYFIRESKETYLRQQLSQKISSDLQNKYQVIVLPEAALMPFEEMVIYDPENEELRWGYMQMTYEGSRSNQPVFILCPSQLVDESVELLKSCYHNSKQESSQDKKEVGAAPKQSHEVEKQKKELLEAHVYDYIKALQDSKCTISWHKDNKKSHVEELIKFFSKAKSGENCSDDSLEGIKSLTKHISNYMMILEPLALRINHDLYLEQQTLVYALQMAWNNITSNASDTLSNKEDTNVSFLSDFVSKINDISSIKNAQDSLVTPEKIATQERAAKEEVMIISPLLYNDLYEQEVQESIAENIKSIIKGERCLRYHYFYFYTMDDECGHQQLKGRDGDLFALRKEAHRVLYINQIKETLNRPWSKLQNVERYYKEIFRFYKIPHPQVIFPFNEMVVFDPNDNQCNWGYMQLNYGDQRAEKVFMKLPQRVLAKLCNILLRYKKRYVTD